MNVLHIHLTDEPAFRLEIPEFPELTKDLDDGFYSADDVSDLVKYAKDRAVRVIHEIDVPGHAGGFRVLNDVGDFCDEAKNTYVKAIFRPHLFVYKKAMFTLPILITTQIGTNQ